MPVDDEVIAAEEAQRRAAEAEERAQHEPLGEPAVPGGMTGGKSSRHDRLDRAALSRIDHGQTRAMGVPLHLAAQLRAQIRDRADDGPAGDGDDEERHHEAHHRFVDRQSEQVERQVPAEHRVGDARGRCAEKTGQRHPQAGGTGGNQGGDDQARDQRRTGRQAREAPRGEAPIDRDERAAKNQHRGKDRALQTEREPEAVQLAEFGEPEELQRNAQGRLEGEDRKGGEGEISQVSIEAAGKRRRRRVAAMPQHRRRERNRRNGQQDQVAQPEHQFAPGAQARPPRETLSGDFSLASLTIGRQAAAARGAVSSAPRRRGRTSASRSACRRPGRSGGTRGGSSCRRRGW